MELDREGGRAGFPLPGSQQEIALWVFDKGLKPQEEARSRSSHINKAKLTNHRDEFGVAQFHTPRGSSMVAHMQVISVLFLFRWLVVGQNLRIHVNEQRKSILCDDCFRCWAQQEFYLFLSPSTERALLILAYAFKKTPNPGRLGGSDI